MAVAQVYAASWPRSVEHIAGVNVRAELLRMRGTDFWKTEIHRLRDRGQFLVAKRSTEVVGYAGSFWEPDGRWELVWLFVQPDMHGWGIGGQLHEQMVVGSTRARLIIERLLWAVPGNRRAERFYSDRGWRSTSVIKGVKTPSGTFPLRKWNLPPDALC